jgi:NAD(P)H-hydrate epimerase
MILSPAQIQATEKRAFAAGVSAEKLMEDAGTGMAGALRQFLPGPGTCVAVFGKGHNGGDALVCARLLSEAGWKVALVPAFERSQWAPLTATQWSRAGRCDTHADPDAIERKIQIEKGPLLILDGLLGIGASGPLREPIASWCRLMNRWRDRHGARIAALDVPTGLDGATGTADPDAIRASWTLTVAFAKPGLLVDGAEHHVGRLVVLPLPDLSRHASPETGPAAEVSGFSNLAPLVPRRTARMHKGNCGRVLLVAGNIGTVGAACLSARGALRAGAGLVTLCVPEAVYAIAAARAPEECMVLPLPGNGSPPALRADALGIGPGLGTESATCATVLEIIRSYPVPAVVDADAINALAAHPALLSESVAPRLLTPHAGEMLRIFPESAQQSRWHTVEHFTRRHPVTLLLKGARTLIGERGQVYAINPTGNPGMASGGMGDVLTGVCTTFLAQGFQALDAARLAAWLCGRSAEILISSGRCNEESLLASEVADHLGAAFESLRRGAY